MLRVVHPSQAEAAEREYMLARLRADWPSLTSALLATHSLPTGLSGKNLLVLCDHNTFANELSLIAPLVEKKIAATYRFTVKINARASQRIDWKKAEAPPDPRQLPASAGEASKAKPAQSPILDELIARIENF
jgi:hypothetical protein